jgi:hypothetical protein
MVVQGDVASIPPRNPEQLAALTERFVVPVSPEHSSRPPSQEYFQKQGAGRWLFVCYSFFVLSAAQDQGLGMDKLRNGKWFSLRSIDYVKPPLTSIEAVSQETFEATAPRVTVK